MSIKRDETENLFKLKDCAKQKLNELNEIL
jgi:hypothetical protein